MVCLEREGKKTGPLARPAALLQSIRVAHELRVTHTAETKHAEEKQPPHLGLFPDLGLNAPYSGAEVPAYLGRESRRGTTKIGGDVIEVGCNR